MNVVIRKNCLCLPSEVLLLASLNANLSQKHAQEKTHVPGNQIQPKFVGESWAHWELCQVLTDGGIEETKEGVSSKSRDWDV